MGWNTSIIAVWHKTAAELLNAQLRSYAPTGAIVSAEVASTSHLEADLALADIKGWCVITQPGGALAMDDDMMADLSLGGRSLGFLLSSVASVYAFSLYGQGQEQRRIVYRDGRVVDERGPALPAEAGIARPSWGYDEDWVFTLLKRLTGIGWAVFEAQQFTAVAASPGA
jgi:hypothetical protein